VGSADPELAQAAAGESPRPARNGSGDPMEPNLAVDEIVGIFRQAP
jgi:hypothetical protein